MFFEPHEKLIYSPPGGKFLERKYDPLRIDRLLVIESSGTLNALITLRNPETLNSGDVSKAGRQQAVVEAAKAELELSRIARVVFGLGEFPDCTDAEALEVLYDFMGWMEGKGSKAGKPPLSESQDDSQSELTPSSLLSISPDRT